ncbi:MAG: hypothetical protein IPG17_29265 [Sandaracinaceae bacterium]|nr:hypothetical protein [Sandaracinaceae bacterium]
MSTDILFDGFDKLTLMLRKLAPQLRYIIVDEVLHRKRSQFLARVNFSALDLAPYLTESAEPPVDEDEDISDDPTEDQDDDELGDLAEAAAAPPTDKVAAKPCEPSVRGMGDVARGAGDRRRLHVQGLVPHAPGATTWARRVFAPRTAATCCCQTLTTPSRRDNPGHFRPNHAAGSVVGDDGHEDTQAVHGRREAARGGALL